MHQRTLLMPIFVAALLLAPVAAYTYAPNEQAWTAYYITDQRTPLWSEYRTYEPAYRGYELQYRLPDMSGSYLPSNGYGHGYPVVGYANVRLRYTEYREVAEPRQRFCSGCDYGASPDLIYDPGVKAYRDLASYRFGELSSLLESGEFWRMNNGASVCSRVYQRYGVAPAACG